MVGAGSDRARNINWGRIRLHLGVPWFAFAFHISKCVLEIYREVQCCSRPTHRGRRIDQIAHASF
jgi:hypothetical protein